MNEDVEDVTVCGRICRRKSGFFFFKCNFSNKSDCQRDFGDWNAYLEHFARIHNDNIDEINSALALPVLVVEPGKAHNFPLEECEFVSTEQENETSSDFKREESYIKIVIDNSRLEVGLPIGISEESDRDALNDESSEDDSTDYDIPMDDDIQNDVRSLSRAANLIYGQVYKCDLCNETVEDKRLLLEHMGLHSRVNLWKCNKCSKTYSSGIEFRRHLQEHLRKDKFYSRIFKGARFQESNKEGKLIKCEICDKILSNSSNYNIHVMRHCEMRYYKCSLCEKTFYWNGDFKSHLKRYHLKPKSSETALDTYETNGAWPDSKDDDNALLSTSLHSDLKALLRIYKCDLCFSMMDNREQLEEHMIEHCSNKLFECGGCAKLFYIGIDLRLHVAKHCQSEEVFMNCVENAEPNVKCHVCDKIVSSKNNYKAHLMRHTKHKYFQCGLCKSAFHVHSDLKRHLRQCHKYECNLQCTDVTKPKRDVSIKLDDNPTTAPTLSVDAKMNTVEETVQDTSSDKMVSDKQNRTCNICKNVFFDKGALEIHMRRHYGVKNYKCEMCLKAFHTNGERSRHLLSHFERPKKPKERKYKCDICGQLLTDPSNLKAHIKRHFDENRKYPCPYCEKRFFTQCETDAHIRSHTGYHPYLCSECGKSYAQKTDFFKHQRRMHGDGERKFKCQFCEKAFFENSKLKEHLLTHSNERNFHCSHCATAFKSRKSLVQHTKIHENRRQYKCTLCDASFNQGPGLRSHMKTKHHTV